MNAINQDLAGLTKGDMYERIKNRTPIIFSTSTVLDIKDGFFRFFFNVVDYFLLILNNNSFSDCDKLS